LNSQCNIPSAFLAPFEAGIVNFQNLIQPIKPFGLSPVTDTYIYKKSRNNTLILFDKLLFLFILFPLSSNVDNFLFNINYIPPINS
jgi:hypothetical protein